MITEFLLISGFFALILMSAFTKTESSSGFQKITLALLIAALCSVFIDFSHVHSLLGGRFVVDPMARVFKLIILTAGILVVSVSTRIYRDSAEFFAVILATLAGMLFLIQARDLLTLYVALETATTPLFLLVAWERSRRSTEAGVKYAVIGALASAFILYGFSILYGLTGTLDLGQIAQHLQPSGALWLAAAMLFAGLGFKLTLFPFHMWAPDVYEGAPTPVAAYLSTASKATGLILAFHLVFRVFGVTASRWEFSFALLAAATMTVGNVIAIQQKNIKRFMAFSSVSQAGYLILGFLDPTSAGASTMLFYAFIYVVTNLIAFGIIALQVDATGREDFESFRGMSQRAPLLALALLIALFGLAGIPPLSGFVGKFFLFGVAAKKGLYWLVGVASINSTISLYYYLRLVRQMYIEAEAPQSPFVLKTDFTQRIVLAVATVLSVVIGIVPAVFEKVSTITAQYLH